jgi:S1-C subfamily serine protease
MFKIIPSSTSGRIVVGLCLCAAIGLTVAGSATSKAYDILGGHAGARAVMQPGDVYRMARPSIARVSITYRVRDKVRRSTGTGFIVDERGDLATNCHVVTADGATSPVSIEIQFPDDPAWLSAKVLGCDHAGDIAVIHVDGLSPNRHPLRFAKPGSFGPGDQVIAVGYALSLDGDPTVSRGIVSAVHRSFEGQFGDLVQTDAVINHGNSGGPLLDMHGQVVGIDTLTTPPTVKVADVVQALKENQTESDGSSASAIDLNVVHGVFYARSATTAQIYVQEIIAKGRVARADLGVEVSFLDPVWYHLPRPGVLVSAVTADSPAAMAGLEQRVVIFAIGLGNGAQWEIRTPGDFRDAMALIALSEPVTVYYYSLTDQGVHLVGDDGSVPASEARWHEVKITPVAPRSSLMAGN